VDELRRMDFRASARADEEAPLENGEQNFSAHLLISAFVIGAHAVAVCGQLSGPLFV
jgi:hypothetical protein